MATVCHRAEKRGKRLQTRISHAQGSTPVKSAPDGTGKAGPPAGPTALGHIRSAGGQRLLYRGRRGEVPLGTCSALSGKPGPLLTPPAVLPLPWATSPLPHWLPEVDCEGTRSQDGNGSISNLPALSPCHKAGRSPRSLRRMELQNGVQHPTKA